jgi:hypothetical protein
MCFSAQASFTVGAALLPIGGYCVSRALRQDRRYLRLAFIPLAFGIQQFVEGCVWLGLHHGDETLTERAAVVYLFGSHAFWPFWVAFSLLPIEERRSKRNFLAATSVVALAWFALIAPLVADPGRWLTVEVVHHSIVYQLGELPGFQFAPRLVWRIAYLAFICVPLLVTSPRRDSATIRPRLIFSGLVLGLFVVSYLVYWYAFTSVWCFFAAIMSLLLGVVFARLPARSDSQHHPVVQSKSLFSTESS